MIASHFMDRLHRVQITKQKATNNIRTLHEGRAGKVARIALPPCPIVASKVVLSVQHSKGIPHESKILTGVRFAFHELFAFMDQRSRSVFTMPKMRLTKATLSS